METMQLMPVRTNKYNLIPPIEYNNYEIVKDASKETQHVIVDTIKGNEGKQNHFIQANTKEVNMHHLKHECVVPVFSKDNELTISHPNFIETVYNAANEFFRSESIDYPEIMVSHVIKGRIPEAIHKPANNLLDTDKTIYYERMAFCFEIPSVSEVIDGNRVNLSVGGVRAYNHENLFSKKSSEKFKVFIGFKNMVCCNLCVSTDGLKTELKAMSIEDLFKGAISLFEGYDPEQHLHLLSSFRNYSLTEHQFAQLVGKTRLYQHLAPKQKKALPLLEFNDSHINMVAKSYYQDENFRNEDGNISLWKLYNLFTGANKNSYIDNFVDRSLNATELARGIGSALNKVGRYNWFIE